MPSEGRVDLSTKGGTEDKVPTPKVRPLRRVREGVARTRDERFELAKGPGCWQVRSLTSEASTYLLSGGGPTGMPASSGACRMVGVNLGPGGMTPSYLIGMDAGDLSTTA